MHTRFDCWALGIGFGIALTVACVDKSVDAGANDVASDSGDGPRRRPARSDSDPAELPRVMIDTKMVTNATGSRRIMVHRGEDLQRAIDLLVWLAAQALQRVVDVRSIDDPAHLDGLLDRPHRLKGLLDLLQQPLG